METAVRAESPDLPDMPQGFEQWVGGTLINLLMISSSNLLRVSLRGDLPVNSDTILTEDAFL